MMQQFALRSNDGKYPPRRLRLFHFMYVWLCCLLLSAGCNAEVGPTYTVTGRVIDADTGKPLAGIPVAMTPESTTRVSKTITNPDGVFRFRVRKNQRIVLGADYVHMRTRLPDVTWLMNHSEAFQVVVGPVIGETGGIELRLRLLPSRELRGKVMKDGRPASAFVGFAYPPPPVRTNRDGTFVISAFPKGKSVDVVAYASDRTAFALRKVAPDENNVVLNLVDGVDVHIRARTNTGQPAARLRFFATLQAGENDWPFVSRSAVTDDHGRCTLGPLAPGGIYNVEWRGNPAYDEGSVGFVAASGKTLDIEVRPINDDWNAPGNLCIHPETRIRKLTAFCLDADGDILACDAARKSIRVISPADEQKTEWRLDFAPEAIECRNDGTVVVAGNGRIALLDSKGKVLKQNRLPGRASTATGVGWSGKDVYVCVPSGFLYKIYRFDERLETPQRIIRGLRGCCGQMDFTARDGVLYVAENTRFRVVRYDRDGRKLGSFGWRKKAGRDGFDGCCEPKNVCFDKKGFLYTAESDSRVIRKWTPEGRFLGKVGACKGIHGCVRVTIAVTDDCRYAYMLDTGRNIIRRVRLKQVAPGAADAGGKGKEK